MIEEIGTVRAVSGREAEVECSGRSACGSCSVKSGCGTALLEQLFARRARLITVENPIGARPGDYVVIGLPEDVLVRTAVGVYLMPLLAMILGAAGAEWLAGMLAPQWTQGVSVIGGLAGLAVGVRTLSRLGSGHAGELHRQVRILRREAPMSPGAQPFGP
jgi:sigma-E factor negative regulatory protein RseC